MIPKITSGGRSFKSAFQYYLHDKDADTSDRVAWTHVENMLTTDPHKAWKVMSYTAKEQERLKEASGQSRAGRKLKKPVFAFSLAWHPEQNPDQAHMLATARKALETLGLTEHEHVFVAHRDEPQKHVHIIVNRVHPLTGLAGNVRNSKRKLSDFARGYEREDGKIYCARREKNHRLRKKGKPTRYMDPIIIEAWQTTDCGKTFVAALEARGYTLAQGRSRLVIVDPHGKPITPTRHLEGVRMAEFKARLKDLDLTKLPKVHEVQQTIKAPAPEQQPAEQKAEELQAQRAEDVARIAEERRETLKMLHDKERAALAAQHQRRLQFAKTQLAEFHGLHEKKTELTRLHKALKAPPWWKKLLRLTRKDQKTFDDKVKVYSEAVHAYRQKIAAIADQNQTDSAEQTRRHENELRDFHARHEKDFDTGRGVKSSRRIRLREHFEKSAKNIDAARIFPRSRSYQR